MANQVMRITLKAYDHQLVDASAKKIIETYPTPFHIYEENHRNSQEKWSTGERTGTASY